MSILESTPGLLDALNGEMTPKFLATRNQDGVPNVVPCVSISPVDDQQDTLIFGNFLLRKSIKNLEADSRLAVMVITEQLNGWILKGDFVEFQRTGPYFERQMNSGLLRYNAYTGVRNIGVIRVRFVEGAFQVSKMQVVGDYLRARLGKIHQQAFLEDQKIKIPIPVQREFARMIAVKVLAWLDEDDYPILRPALSLQPRGDSQMAAWLGNGGLPIPPEEIQAAANILTFEAISYQAKGIWKPKGKAGTLQVQEIYAGGPPYPGGRVA